MQRTLHGGAQEGPLRTPTDAPDCPGYQNQGEVDQSRTAAGHLPVDVFELPLGGDDLLVADYGVEWGSLKDSTRSEAVFQANLSALESDASGRWKIVGYSDCVGNEHDRYLRWRRAKKLYDVLSPAAQRRASAEIAPLGEYVMANDTVEHRAMNRGVLITRIKGDQPPRPSDRDHVCGPDATKWFIDQVEAAKKDPAVLRVKNNMTIARSVLAGLGLSMDLIALGLVSQKVGEAQKDAGMPPFKGAAKQQILESFSGTMAVAQAEQKAQGMNALELAQFKRAASLLQDAALTWKALVETRARYDFKNSPSTLQNPRSDHCPKDCNHTITLAGLCLLKDVPGNLFYAHVGRFVGWLELTLQLGSQLAQLLSTKDWDPPEDTAMIKLGFGLPDPLTVQALHDALAGGAKILDKSCSICRETIHADIV